MKVKLATQLLSMSVAKAITLCDDLLKSSKFKDSFATVNFITIMNNFFDVMNSRKFYLYGFKRPIDKKKTNQTFLPSWRKSRHIYFSCNTKCKPKELSKERTNILKS